jgi:hypothetical protein
MASFDKSHEERPDGTCDKCGADLAGSLGKAKCAAADGEAEDQNAEEAE